MLRRMGRTRVLPCLVLALAATASHAGGGAGAKTSITIWGAPPANAAALAAYGGQAYGGFTSVTGAMITEQREVDVGANGELRIAGVPNTVDPASVQLRSVSDGGGVTVTEQRFVPGATTPDEILSRHVGDAITVVTPKGEVAGTLRSVDAQAIVVEVGTGDQRRLQVMRRDGYVQDVRLPAGTSVDKPSLVWRLASKKPGKHTVEVSYRADGMSWTADYLAILDEAAKTIDFSAWATIKNTTNATFDGAEVTLVTAGTGTTAQGAAGMYQPINLHANAPPTRFTVPSAIKLGAGESVQVELLPAKSGAKARTVVTFEAMNDPSGNFQQFQAVDCNQFSQSAGTGRAEVALEIDVPAQSMLPDGRARLFKRSGSRLEVVSEDPLRSSAGVARIRLSPDNDVTGDRHAASCNYDERTHTIREKIELKLENKGKQGVDVVAREFMWRWPMWKVEDESPKGMHAGPQTQEYKVNVPAGGKKTVTYTVVYSW
jgi:hypothetical protein